MFSRRFSVPRFVPFRVSLLHLALFFPLLPVLCPEPLPPCGQRQGKHTLRLRRSRSLALWKNSLLSQVMSPSSLTTSTTRRLLRSSSGYESSDTVPSYLSDAELDDETIDRALFHHCSFRSEKNQRTEDKLITPMKKVCCQLSHFSHTQERGDPCTNSVRLVRAEKSQVARW